MEIWSVTFGELNSHESTYNQEEDDEEVDYEAFRFGILRDGSVHKSIIYEYFG